MYIFVCRITNNGWQKGVCTACFGVTASERKKALLKNTCQKIIMKKCWGIEIEGKGFRRIWLWDC